MAETCHFLSLCVRKAAEIVILRDATGRARGLPCVD
jgi:hypothetical protein